MENLDAVPSENRLARLELEGKIVAYVRERISKIPNYDGLKHDAECVLLICNLIENAVKKKGQFDKKELVLSIHSKLFTHTANDRQVVDNIIQFVFDRGQIHKLSSLKKVFHFLSRLLRKLL
jgi:hypothetical protein